MEKGIEYNKRGLTKAAILLLGLGSKVSALIMQDMSEKEIEVLTKEISSLENIPPEEMERVQEEFRQMVLAQEYITIGGMEYAKEVLEEAFGPTKALEIIKRIQRSMVVRGFNVLKKIDTTQLLNFVMQEHPQTIALVLTQLDAQQAADILTQLPAELRNEVMYRFATMDRVPPDMIKSIEASIESTIDINVRADTFGGVNVAAEILNQVGQTVEKAVLEDMSIRNPEMAENIKKLMFVFEDLRHLSDMDMQRILKEVDLKDVTLALKAGSDEIKEKIFGNMSQRAVDMVKEELELMGPVRLSDVEKTQQRIVDIVRKLAEQEEITLAGPGRKEDVFV